MADNSIDDIYEEIRSVLLGQSLKESKEYFDFDNIPDSLSDKSFIIAPVPLDPGDLATPDDRLPLWNLNAKFKIFISMKLPGNNITQKLKSSLLTIEGIIKGILSIVCGQDEKDSIVFDGMPDPVVNNSQDIIFEMNFNLNYRIKNI
jgi:hypothetical protein